MGTPMYNETGGETEAIPPPSASHKDEDSSGSDDSHEVSHPVQFPPMLQQQQQVNWAAPKDEETEAIPPPSASHKDEDSSGSDDSLEASHPVQFPPMLQQEQQQQVNWAAPEDEVPVQFPPQPEVQHVPPVQPPPLVIGLPWTTGLFECHEHETNAVLTAFFPCVTFGQIVEILDGGQTRCSLGSLMYMMMAPAVCSCWILGSMYRGRLRQRYNLVEAPTEDWIYHAFCPCCALCQEFRELENRGIDPSLRWNGNLAQVLQQQQQQQAATIPPNTQSMVS